MTLVTDADRKLVDHPEFLGRIVGLRDQKGATTRALLILEKAASVVHAKNNADMEIAAVELAGMALKLAGEIRKGKVGT